MENKFIKTLSIALLITTFLISSCKNKKEYDEIECQNKWEESPNAFIIKCGGCNPQSHTELDGYCYWNPHGSGYDMFQLQFSFGCENEEDIVIIRTGNRYFSTFKKGESQPLSAFIFSKHSSGFWLTQLSPISNYCDANDSTLQFLLVVQNDSDFNQELPTIVGEIWWYDDEISGERIRVDEFVFNKVIN